MTLQNLIRSGKKEPKNIGLNKKVEMENLITIQFHISFCESMLGNLSLIYRYNKHEQEDAREAMLSIFDQLKGKGVDITQHPFSTYYKLLKKDEKK